MTPHTILAMLLSHVTFASATRFSCARSSVRCTADAWFYSPLGLIVAYLEYRWPMDAGMDLDESISAKLQQKIRFLVKSAKIRSKLIANSTQTGHFAYLYHFIELPTQIR